MASASTSKVIHAGARYYGALTLPLYDWAVLKTVVPLAWRCPLHIEQQMYDENIGGKHLDIGVASGYILKHAQYKSHDHHHQQQIELTLMDLNPKSTQYAAERLSQTGQFSAIHQVVGDALEPFPVVNDDQETIKFDSIAMFHLLHCIPGNLKEKKVALQHAARVVKPESGVVFGANVTPSDCPHMNPLARAVLALSHQTGALNNQLDSARRPSKALHYNQKAMY